MLKKTVGDLEVGQQGLKGVIKELKEREFHVKPSEKRRVEKARAVARWKKKVTASEKYFSSNNNRNRRK